LNWQQRWTTQSSVSSAGRRPPVSPRALVDVSRATSLPPPAPVSTAAADNLRHRRRPSISYSSNAQRSVYSYRPIGNICAHFRYTWMYLQSGPKMAQFYMPITSSNTNRILKFFIVKIRKKFIVTLSPKILP